MDNSIFRFILRYSARQQVAILLLTLASFPFLYMTLELPKWIVNDAISGTDFPKNVLGIELGQVPYLLLLSGLFLLFVVLNGAFKLHINTMKGRLGERMLRRLRYELYQRVMRFPLPHFRKVSAGEIIPMITAEVEPIGGFIGDAFAQPIFQGGTLLVYIGFIFAQDPFLGAAAIALYPFQGWLIPRLQRKVNQLGKQRVQTMRQISDKIGESVGGIQDIHSNNTIHWHLADIARRFGDVYDIRFEIYRRKFFIKFLNNFINQLTPFFFYSIGGYLVIRGDLSFGALIAVLAAYKDLAGPWKELLDYYQLKEDTRIKYEQVIRQFDVPGLMPADVLNPAIPDEEHLSGSLRFVNVSFGEDGSRILERVTCTIPLDQHTAVLGGAGTDELALLVARLLRPSGGRILLGDEDYARLPQALIGRRVAYVGANTYFFGGDVRDNLLYGLRHRPMRPASYTPEQEAQRQRRAAEAAASGNTLFDPAADWIDYEAAGCDGPESLRRRLLELLDTVDLTDDVYGFGLRGRIDPGQRPDLAAKILEARGTVREKLRDPRLESLVELFDPDRFNTNASVAENLLFGTPVGETFATENMARNPYVLHILDKTGLTREFLETGIKVAREMIELFADLPPGHDFFEQFSFIGSDELPEYQPMVQKAEKSGPGALTPEERQRIMTLPFKLIPARHRLGLVEEDTQARILEARRLFAAELPDDLKPAVEFFDASRYNRASTIQDNILLGKLAYGTAQAGSTVGKLIGAVIDRLNLREEIIEVGLDAPVGIGGSRLSASQRQKLALARALLKDPDLLVLNQATSWLDGVSQNRVHANLLAERKGRGIFWVVHRPAMARSFERVLVLRAGQVAEEGTFEELSRDGTAFSAFLAAE